MIYSPYIPLQMRDFEVQTRSLAGKATCQERHDQNWLLYPTASGGSLAGA